MLKICISTLILIFCVQTAFSQHLLKSEELSLDEEDEIYPLKIKPNGQLKLLRKESSIVIIKNGKKSFLTGTESPLRYHVISFTIHGDSSVYFFILSLDGIRTASKIYTLVNEQGKNAEKKLFGKNYGGLAGVEINDAANTISTIVENNPDCAVAAGRRFVFTPKGIKIIETWTVNGADGEITRTDSWYKNQPQKITSKLVGEPFTAVIREKTFIAAKPADTALTKKYLVPGDTVLVSDIIGYWIKVTCTASKETGWINGNGITPGW